MSVDPTLEAVMETGYAAIYVTAASGSWVSPASGPLSDVLATWAAYLTAHTGETYSFYVDAAGLVHLDSTEAFSATWGTSHPDGIALALGFPSAGIPSSTAHTSASTPAGLLVDPVGVAVGVPRPEWTADDMAPSGRATGQTGQRVRVSAVIPSATWSAVQQGPLLGGRVQAVDSAGTKRELLVTSWEVEHVDDGWWSLVLTGREVS